MTRKPFPVSTLSFAALLFAPSLLRALCAAPATPDAVDIRLAGHLVGRYVTAHDVSSPARRQETYKPFLHIMDAEGRLPSVRD